MKKLIILLLFCNSAYSGALENIASKEITKLITNASNMVGVKTPENAVKKTSEALANTRPIKDRLKVLDQGRKRLERMFYGALERQLGLKKNSAITIYTIGTMISKQEFDSTKVRYNIKLKRVNFRPDIYYSWRSNEYRTLVNFTMGF